MRMYARLSTDEEIVLAVDGQDFSAQLYNLSCGGCMIEVETDLVAEGKKVEVHLSDQIALRGKVAWRIGRNAGIEFGVRLHTKVVESFGFDKDAEFDAEDQFDRFGLPLDAVCSAAAGRRE